MTRIAVLISPNLGADFERSHEEPEPSASGAHPGAGRSPGPEALPAVLREASEPPPRALPGPPASPGPDLGLSLRLSSAESASSLPSLARQGRFSEMQAPGSPPLPSAASGTHKQSGLHAGTRDARTRARLARDLGRAGPGGGAVTGVPGTPRHAP